MTLQEGLHHKVQANSSGIWPSDRKRLAFAAHPPRRGCDYERQRTLTSGRIASLHILHRAPQGWAHGRRVRDEERHQARSRRLWLGSTHRRQQVLAEQFGQTRGHRVGDKHCFLRQRASETEVVRECLQAGAFAQRKRPVLRWVDELRVGTACNRFRRLAWHQTSQSSRRSATPFAWRPVHHAPVRTAPVGVVPKTLRQVLHRLAWAQRLHSRCVHAPWRSEVVIGQRRASSTLSRHRRRQSLQSVLDARTRRETAAYRQRSGHPRGAVRNAWESRVPAQATKSDYSLAMLRNAVVRRVDFPHVDAIARRNEWVEQIDHPLAFVTSEKSFHILEQECLRPMACHEVGENGNQGVAAIAWAAFAGGREPLARRPADNDIRVRQCALPMQALDRCPVGEIQAVALHRGRVAIRRMDDAKAGCLQASAQAAGAAEQIRDCRMLLHPVKHRTPCAPMVRSSK